MASQNRVPLFINRYSLSQRTAIGVQTLRLLGPHQDWLHFHWWTSSFQRLDPRSVLFENTVLSRFPFLHRPKTLRFFEMLGISSWSGSDLRPSLAKRLIAPYRGRVSSAYVAPLGEDDATRCLELTNLMGVPFVLHLWDVLDGDVANGALRELVDRAERVFCVSQPLLDDVLKIRADADLLSFSRDASQVTAKPREQGPIKVVIHGNVCSYAQGLNDLDQAIDLLERKGLPVEVSFLGSPKILRLAKTTIKKRVKVRGFLPTQRALDKELSSAHVGFLPGPKLDPGSDLRSRYSIPSRSSTSWPWIFPLSVLFMRPPQPAALCVNWASIPRQPAPGRKRWPIGCSGSQVPASGRNKAPGLAPPSTSCRVRYRRRKSSSEPWTKWPEGSPLVICSAQGNNPAAFSPYPYSEERFTGENGCCDDSSRRPSSSF